MRIVMLLAAMAAWTALMNPASFAQTNEVVKVRVTGDRVSMRAEPGLEGYLIDRAMRDQEMVVLDKTNGWVAVQAPDSLDFWVAGEYVSDGVVLPDLLNVRAGPSLNYAKVAELAKGDPVTVRGEFNAWVKIAPPENSRVWISGDYVEFIQPPAPEPLVDTEPVTAVVAEDAGRAPAPEKAEIIPEKKALPPLVLMMDKTKEQGVYVEIPGVLRRANPGLYKLVLIDAGWEETICLVRGSEPQMERYLNRSMLIKGRRFWAKGVDIPVVEPEKIHLDPILAD